MKILARKFKCTLISLKGIMKINRVILIFLARKSKLWNFWNFLSNNLKLTRLGTSASKFFWNFYQLKNREYKGSNNVNFQVLVVISDFFCPLEKISRHKLSVSFFVSFVGGPKAINSSSSSLQKESNASKRWQYCPSVKFNRCKNSNVK